MNKNLIKNIISLLGIQGMNYIIPLITLPYLVKTLGPASYGALGFSLALIQYFTRLTDYGFNLTATKDIASNKDALSVSKVFWSVFACKFLLTMLSLGGVLLLIEFSSFIYGYKQVILCSFGMVIGSFLFPIWLFQGLEKMGWIAIANIGSRLITIPFIFIFVTKPEDVWIAALVTSLTSILAGIVSFFYIIKYKWIKIVKITKKDIFHQFKSGFHIFLSSGAVSLYTTSIPIFLGFVSGPIAVGYYVAADKLRLAVQGVISPVSQAIYPRIVDILSRDKSKALFFIKKLFKIQAGFTLILSVIVMTSSGVMIHALYGAHYEQSIIILCILSPTIFLVGVSNVLGTQVMLTFNYKAAYSKIVMIAAFLNMLIIFPLVYILSDKGAAISVLATELFVVIAMYYKLRKIGIKI